MQAGEGAGRNAATIAELAAAIARVERGGTGGDGAAAPGDRPRRGSESLGSAPQGPARAVVAPAQPDDPAGDGGDPPGDPESVARSICLRLLASRARSRSDLAGALRRRGVPDGAAERVLDRFVEVGLIDDAAYAAAFVSTKHRDRGLGRSALRGELRRKGIDPLVAEAAVGAVGEDAERRRAAALIAKKLDSAMFAGLPAARRRLLGLLARRGYSASLAADTVNEALRGYVDPIEPPDGDEPPVEGWAEEGASE